MAFPAEKRCRTTAPAAAIPDDLLIDEVLVRLPVKSLARCRCVCCSWRAGIAGAGFIRRHLELSRKRPPSLLSIPRKVHYYDEDDDQATMTPTTEEISFDRISIPQQRVLGTTYDAELMFEKPWPQGITCLISPIHCDGLVAVATATDKVFVCNPATREFVALPPGSHNTELDYCEFVMKLS